MASRHEKEVEADIRCRHWKLTLNELEERGVTSGKAHEEAERKCQFWLDRFNKLSGWA